MGEVDDAEGRRLARENMARIGREGKVKLSDDEDLW
jgi:hypothetical protein